VRSRAEDLGHCRSAVASLDDNFELTRRFEDVPDPRPNYAVIVDQGD
jgi:hypothetical protein